MKNSSILLTLLLSAILFGVISCQSSSSEKLKDAEADVVEADKNLSEAREEYKADMDAYKKHAATTFTANQQSIKEFKARIANSKKEVKADYEKKINDLEQKNADLKRKLDEYKTVGDEQWKLFKKEFSHDLNELGKALKDLTVNNVE